MSRTISAPFKLGLAAILSGQLSGCLLGPEYTRPEQQLGQSFYEPNQTGAAFANLAWWDVFADPVLQKLIREALDSNKDLKVAAARIEQARALLGVTRADQFPRIDLSGNASRLDVSDNVLRAGQNPINDFGLFGDLSFEIDIWGKLRRATEAQEAELLSTEYAQRAIVVSLIAQVASTYYQILGLENRLAISRATVKNRTNSTNLIRERFKQGVVPELDVNQAQIEQASVAADAATFERDLRQSEHALSVLLGKMPGQIPRGLAFGSQPLRDSVPAGFPAELLERRPDVLAAEEAYRAEVARIGIAEADRLPSLNLLGFVGLQSSRGSDFPEARSFTWSIGGNILGPLVDFGKSKSAEEAARARAQAAMFSYEQTVLQAVREVEDSIVGIRTSKEGYEQRILQTKAAANAARLSRARYDEGVTTYLEVLDIERSLFEAELGASANRELYLISIVQLYKSLGGGWIEPQQDAKAVK